MNTPEKMLEETPSQTAGPYVHIGLTPGVAGLHDADFSDPGAVMIGADTPGERVTIVGVVRDGEGAPLCDALIEVWQADAEGHYRASERFTGWGRQASNLQDGHFRFETIKPGRVPGPDGRQQAPHLALWIVARGINLGLHTRLYFPEDAAAQAEDPVLGCVPPARRHTLIAHRDAPGHYRFDIRLQGDDETVFFDL